MPSSITCWPSWTKPARTKPVPGRKSRGAQALYRATQALALLEGRDYVIPDDVKRLVIPVFAHRIAVNPRASLSQRSAEVTERILQDILTLLPVPL